MDDKTVTVPYIVYESAMARNERHIKRLLLALLITIVLLVVTNLAWMGMWNSYDYSDVDESVSLKSGSGIANYIGESGDISGIDNGQTENENMD